MSRLVLAAVIVIAGAIQQAQQPQTAPQPQTTFRSGIDRVAVDVSVIDSDGRPVSDLTAADFSLEVDGRRRDITSAEFISLRRLIDPGPPPAYYSSNTASRGGRLIMLIVDQNHIRAGTGKLVFDAASKFIASLNPTDRVGLHLLPGAGPLLDFTSNHALVAQMLRQAVGRAPRTISTGRIGISEAMNIVRNNQSTINEVIDRECAGSVSEAERRDCQRILVSDARSLNGERRSRTAESLVGLRDIMRRLRAGRTRKTIVLLSEGLIVDQGVQDLAWVPPAAAESQISLYVLQMEPASFDASSGKPSPSLLEDRALEKEGLELLAGLAGGAVVPLSPSNPWLGFSRVSTEVSGYYLLSFEPDAAERDGRMHKIKIEVKRRGLVVRARKEFAMQGAPDEKALQSRLVGLLRAPIDLTDISLKVAPYVMRDADGKLKLLVTAEIDRSASSASDATMGFTVVDQQGRIAGSHIEPSLGPSTGGVQRTTAQVTLDPGVYSLRLGVVDNTGREGSVGHTFEARLASAGQLRWSDLLLAEQDAATKTIAPLTDGPAGSTLLAYLELYSDVQPMLDRATVSVEIARTAESLAVTATNVRFSAAQQPGRRSGEASLDVALLGEGEFVARAIISVDGKEAGRALRTFRLGPRQNASPLR